MATLRMLCVPFSGAGAGVFRGWAEALPAHVEPFAIQLPGREDRLQEPAIGEWPAMFATLSAAIAALHPQRTVLFGHSLGAVVAFELARWMHAAAIAPLEHLFVSARPWPGHPAASLPPLWAGDDDALLAAMAHRFGPLPASLSHPEIRDLVLPVLRTDLQLLGSHRHAHAPPLPCPITLFAGRDDPSTDDAALAGWSTETTASFEIVRFAGGHFFLDTHRHEVLAEIGMRLPAPAAAW